MTLVDSHCHLDSPQFAEDRDAVIARAREAGVERFLAIGTGEGPPDLEAGIRLAGQYAGAYATIGVHPHDAAKAGPETFERLKDLCSHPKVVALGEIGLDYHYDFAPRGVQLDAFRTQVAIAQRTQLPVVIHTREAWSDTVAILREHCPRGPGIIHCFSGDVEQAREAVSLGFHVSFGGVLTFPRAQGVREAAATVPDELLLVETDAPFLAPVPRRGKRNEPSFLVETVRVLAAVRGVSPEAIAALTTRNFERLCLEPRGLQHADPGGYTGEFHEQR